MSEQQAEADLLALAAATFEDEGYTVVREPSPDYLPRALRDLRPDAIAIGKRPFLVIEVVQQGAQYADRVRQLQRAAEEAADWRLHLIVDTGERQTRLEQVPAQTIAAALSSARKLTDLDGRAALLLAWASFEALARAMEPSKFAKPQTPGRIVERLASEGVITPTEAANLRKLANVRNAVVHGELQMQPSPNDLQKFLGVLDRLLTTVSRKADAPRRVKVYIEPRPKGRPEGTPIEDYSVEEQGGEVLTTTRTQQHAIDWARQHGHRALVARVRNTDKGNPGHWRSAGG